MLQLPFMLPLGAHGSEPPDDAHAAVGAVMCIACCKAAAALCMKQQHDLGIWICWAFCTRPAISLSHPQSVSAQHMRVCRQRGLAGEVQGAAGLMWQAGIS